MRRYQMEIRYRSPAGWTPWRTYGPPVALARKPPPANGTFGPGSQVRWVPA